ncbi:hypothetical protein BDW75DRAFT_247041 [Aspergillus navahoensis]
MKMFPPHRPASACDHCRLRRRRCDRIRPRCSLCASQGVACVYGQAPNSQPSPLVQELVSIRERLESITPILRPSLDQSTQPGPLPPVALPWNCPPLVLKSPHVMLILKLPADTAYVLYLLSSAVPPTPEAPAELPRGGSTDLILAQFRIRVQQWYPVLHPDYLTGLLESETPGFSYSTKACLSLLVTSLACLGDDRLESSPYVAALSMIPMVIQESSVTSIQCLVLFSIHFACQLRPRQAHEYIQIACLKIQPFLKSTSLAQGYPESHLITRLYWIIYMIDSEISMHLNLSSLRGRKHSRLAAPMPTSTDNTEYSDGSSLPSRSSSQDREDYSPMETLQPPDHFTTEIQLQLALNRHASSTTNAPSKCDDTSRAVSGNAASSDPLDALVDMLDLDISLDVQHPASPQHIPGSICRVKHHLYKVSIYWPMIYRVIVEGPADLELLPYGPLFFESVTSCLCAAEIALRVCLPKAWFLCASIYIVSNAAVKALEVPSLRLLALPRVWECLEASVNALHRQSVFSPSVGYMQDTLKDRLEMVKVRKSG